jgi:tetratricopeptide (TPR) repeat protein
MSHRSRDIRSNDRAVRPALVRAVRTVAWLAFAMTSAIAIGGCGLVPHAHRGEPTARAAKAAATEAPKLTAVQQKLADAREQGALDPGEPYWAFRTAEIYVESDSLARAEAALKACLAGDPVYVPALALLSKLYYDSGRHDLGVQLLEAARARAGAFPNGVPAALLAGLALHYEALGRHQQAAAVVGDARHPGDDQAGTALVYVTLRGDHPEAAAGLARAALDADSHSAANQNNYGITKLRAGDPKAARDAFLRAIDLDSRLPGPYYNLAIVERFFFFDEEAAARWLKAYRERASDDPDNLFGPVAGGEAKPAPGKER